MTSWPPDTKRNGSSGYLDEGVREEKKAIKTKDERNIKIKPRASRRANQKKTDESPCKREDGRISTALKKRTKKVGDKVKYTRKIEK